MPSRYFRHIPLIKRQRDMVLSDRNSEELRSGRRSRAASPNGHLSDESSATDESEYSMKVGDEYQATVPDLISTDPCPELVSEKALLVWSPCCEITEKKLDEYINLAKEKYGYNVEQALGMLFWHKYDLEKAIADLLNFTPFPDEWSIDDKIVFEQAFSHHGKCFHKIRQMLPDKPISSLVKYYYSWKKVRTKTSVMDCQLRKLSSQKDYGSDLGSEAPSENDSDFEVDNNKEDASSGKKNCSNCAVSSSQLYNTPNGSMCNSCFQYLKRNGSMRNSAGAIKKHESTSARHNPMRSKRKPPRGMHLNYDDLVAIATGSSAEGESILRSIDSEIISLKRQVQNNKQMVSQLKHKTSNAIDSVRPSEGGSRINPRWSSDELLLAVQGVRKYGRDLKAISEIIGNKTEGHIRNFFHSYCRRFNIDAVLREYDAEHGIVGGEFLDEKVESDKNGTNSGNNSYPNSPGITPQTAPPLLHPPHSPSSGPTITNHPRLCPPPLQQANSSRSSSSRTLLQHPPPLICPTTSYVNGNVKSSVHDGC